MILTSTIFLANLSAYVMPRPMWHKCSSKTRGQYNEQKQKKTQLLHEVFFPGQDEKTTPLKLK